TMTPLSQARSRECSGSSRRHPLESADMTETAVQADRVSEVEARSGALHRELRLFDLVLIQVMYIVGSGWVGAAARLGPSHVVFWTLAGLAFSFPQGAGDI